MAEALALVASVVAVVQITDRIVDICKFYVETVKDAPSALRVILIEISTLKTILDNVKFLLSCPAEVSTSIGTLASLDKPIAGCHQSIIELEQLLPSDVIQRTGPNRNKKRKTKATLAALAWPLKESKARKLLDDIMRYKSTIMFALTTENTRDIKDLKTKTSKIKDALTDVQRETVLRWLQHTDPSPFHYQAKRNFEPETGTWILCLPEWADWLKSKHRCLWLHGLPGAGKTVLISSLIEQTQKHCNESSVKKCGCVYYYFYFGHYRDETVPFLQWLLNQLCRLAGLIPKCVHILYKRSGQPDVVELLGAIADILVQFDTIFVIVDAVDESDPRDDLLKVLSHLVVDSRFQKVQLLASSREYIDIERIMDTISIPVSMANPHVEEDIRTHIRSVLQVNPNFRRWPPELLAEVETIVSQRARGMFRWAVCQIDALQRLKAEHRIVKEALADLPKTLDETYDRILLKVPEEDHIIVHHALQWIRYHGELHSGEGIPCEILVQAIAKSIIAYDDKLSARYYDMEVIWELCGCPIKVVPQDFQDSPWGIKHASFGVLFAHFTVQEYLDSSRKSKSATFFSTACKTSLWQNFTTIVFEEARQVQMNKLWARRDLWKYTEEAFFAVEKKLDTYWMASAVLSYPKSVTNTSLIGGLRPSILEFANPSKPHYKTMGFLMRFLETSIAHFSMHGTGVRGLAFWKIKWDDEASDADASVLVNILHLGCHPDEQLPLMKAFLEGKNAGTLLQASLKFRMSIDSRSRINRDGDYVFNGRLIEILASLPLVRNVTLMHLLEYEPELSNSATLLFAYTGRHTDVRDPCKGKCPLRHFLNCGANPNALEYRVTPLQVATYIWDLEGVQVLLSAGADPNYIGSHDGVIWEKGTYIGRFEFLRGISPLHICRKFGPALEEWVMPDRKVRHVEVEAELLKYGAKISSNYTT